MLITYHEDDFQEDCFHKDDPNDKEGNANQDDIRQAREMTLEFLAQPVEMRLPFPYHEMGKGLQRQVFHAPKCALKIRLFCHPVPVRGDNFNCFSVRIPMPDFKKQLSPRSSLPDSKNKPKLNSLPCQVLIFFFHECLWTSPGIQLIVIFIVILIVIVIVIVIFIVVVIVLIIVIVFFSEHLWTPLALN